MKVITLIENTKGSSKDLICEHGLSIYIETNNKRILFDTGRTDSFIINANNLGINLEKIDAAVISHGHSDHGGGLLPFLDINHKAKVYAKKGVNQDYYFNTIITSKNVSINKEVFNKHSRRFNYVDEFTEIMDNVYIITDIEKPYEVPKGNKYLFAREGEKVVRDKFNHELIMVIRENDELIIFTGCSHNGTANMIETVRNRFPNLKIKALIGGFHLVKMPLIESLGASQEEIDIIVRKIKDENIEKVYTGHCTGEKAFKKLENALGSDIIYIRTGMEMNI
ncbi:metal dependent hydrolase [Clostridium tetani]|uniref:MBL fold metallo-hydrolase n=1 Tax=Clostridium tetani TaxID=1513 RepID=UPI000D204ED9|nr:MBL fold metallo-hydrolase [Clostridium tetani]AVP54055.1 MBL fold metallo-hydrolase [Clostridium tetani]RXI77176.1 MBL fold metallo-hydrolase [Clostridium tetani]RXM57328.1 MBL fold metallo-hydrolase [Clostridium tetani]RXM77153.1 MBL fold metallo-hydrolase [Clostridium tetani]RYU99397.1 MBL fold metallo-hydrolase [Clostridium tetani]